MIERKQDFCEATETNLKCWCSIKEP